MKGVSSQKKGALIAEIELLHDIHILAKIVAIVRVIKKHLHALVFTVPIVVASALKRELLKFELNLFANMVLVIDDPLLYALYDLLTLKLEVKILAEYSLTMTLPINKEMYR
jgi:hypothetical protein